jgi:hypothetical protein
MVILQVSVGHYYVCSAVLNFVTIIASRLVFNAETAGIAPPQLGKNDQECSRCRKVNMSHDIFSTVIFYILLFIFI